MSAGTRTSGTEARTSGTEAGAPAPVTAPDTTLTPDSAPEPGSTSEPASTPVSGSAPDPASVLVDAEVGVRSSAAGAAARRALLAHPALLLVGIVLASLNMRAALASVAPLVGEISASFGLSATASSLVTSVPVLFLGVGAAVAPWLGRRFGAERVLFAVEYLRSVAGRRVRRHRGRG
ncbi:hypothetical protein ABZ054_26585, partial [Streptomyces sp. NPDC006324]